jgi:hypothetical protein
VANAWPIREEDLREPDTYASVATVRVSRDELAERDIRFEKPVEDRTWTEAGPIEVAFVETMTGEQPLFVWPEGFEGTAAALDLRAPTSTSNPASFVDAVLDALHLPRDRREWLVDARHWPPYPSQR